MNGYWYEQAKCLEMEPRDFDVEDVTVMNRDKDKEAWELCKGCKVAPECARDALEYDDQSVVRAGVWVPRMYHKERRKQLDKLRLVMDGFVSC